MLILLELDCWFFPTRPAEKKCFPGIFDVVGIKQLKRDFGKNELEEVTNTFIYKNFKNHSLF